MVYGRVRVAFAVKGAVPFVGVPLNRLHQQQFLHIPAAAQGLFGIHLRKVSPYDFRWSDQVFLMAHRVVSM
jgi:hypothetical protein